MTWIVLGSAPGVTFGFTQPSSISNLIPLQHSAIVIINKECVSRTRYKKIYFVMRNIVLRKVYSLKNGSWIHSIHLVLACFWNPPSISFLVQIEDNAYWLLHDLIFVAARPDSLVQDAVESGFVSRGTGKNLLDSRRYYMVQRKVQIRMFLDTFGFLCLTIFSILTMQVPYK